jgi:hypothetical protein
MEAATAMDFHSLSRRELQALCKRNGVRANMTNSAMADALQGLDSVSSRSHSCAFVKRSRFHSCSFVKRSRFRSSAFVRPIRFGNGS